MKKPEFNDTFAKTRIREHKKFGGKVVEILYGAHDAEGKPVAPNETAEDGHGRWYGMECNGEYTMFSWKHSAEEGGALEYGTEYGDKAVETMEADLQKKYELVRETEDFCRGSLSSDGAEKLEDLRKQFEAMPDWKTPKDAEYQKRFEKAAAEYGPRAEAAAEAKAAKQAVLDKAEALRNSERFNDARKALKDLRDEMYDLASAGEEADNEFRKKLNDIDRELRQKQDEYYQNRDSSREAAKAKKEELIARTKELVADIKNYKQTGDKLNNLFNEWKAAGSAGHELDETLWADFNAARQKFYDARKEYFAQREAQWNQSIEAKKKLIEEAKEISAKNDFGKENTDRMKQLDVEWKAAGFSGKEQNDALWDEFQKSKEVFWDGKKAVADAKVQAVLDAKVKKLEDLKKEIEDLQYRQSLDDKPSMKEYNERQIYSKSMQVPTLEKEIAELKERLGK